MPELRPIDANALLEEMQHPLKYEKSESDTDIDVYMRIVENAPTLEYEPVVHAHWIQKGFDCKCSNCGSFNGAFGVKYCQDCGAKMDEEVQSNANNNS